MPKNLSMARRHGIHPLPQEPGYTAPYCPVTIKMPLPVWHWLKGFVGNNSFFFCVEETIVTALRCMAGKDCEIGMDVAQLVSLAAMEREISPAVAMFGPMSEEAERHVSLLIQAAEAAAHGTEWVARGGLDNEPAREEAILKAWSAVSGRDIAAQVEQDRQRQAIEDADHAKRFLDSHDPDSPDFAERFPEEHAAIKAAEGGTGKHPYLSEDIDDDIPF